MKISTRSETIDAEAAAIRATCADNTMKCKKVNNAEVRIKADLKTIIIINSFY